MVGDRRRPGIPDGFEDLLIRPLLAQLATIRPDGTPQVHPMWFAWDGERIRLSSTSKRAKHRNLQANPVVAVCIADPEAYRHIEIRGRIERIEPDPEGGFWRTLAARYGEPSEHPPPDAPDRVTYLLKPHRIATFGRRPDWPARTTGGARTGAARRPVRRGPAGPGAPSRDEVSVLADRRPHVEDLPYEVVERKGVGHPDTMADAIAERASRYYSRSCLEQFGRVAHHWFDKVLLFGGESELSFRGGELVRPYTVLFAGKAARACGSQPIPLDELLRRAAADVLAEVLTGFDPARHLRVENRVVDHQGPGRVAQRYRPRGPDDLVAIGAPGMVSNDANLLHGFAPLSRLERGVLLVERELTGPDFKAANPDTGWDVKVLGFRRGDRFSFVVNLPFLAARIGSARHYAQRVAACRAQIEAFLAQCTGSPVGVVLNPADRGQRVYLTALGSVADTGDVGAVGRGNRTNGLITPMRPMSIEAAAGKNPLDHTGKLYSVLARDLAESLAADLDRPVEVHVHTSKEAPLERPDQVTIRVHGWEPDPGTDARIRDAVAESFCSIGDLTRRIIDPGVTMW